MDESTMSLSSSRAASLRRRPRNSNLNSASSFNFQLNPKVRDPLLESVFGVVATVDTWPKDAAGKAKIFNARTRPAFGLKFTIDPGPGAALGGDVDDIVDAVGHFLRRVRESRVYVLVALRRFFWAIRVLAKAARRRAVRNRETVEYFVQWWREQETELREAYHAKLQSAHYRLHHSVEDSIAEFRRTCTADDVKCEVLRTLVYRRRIEYLRKRRQWRLELRAKEAHLQKIKSLYTAWMPGSSPSTTSHGEDDKAAQEREKAIKQARMAVLKGALSGPTLVISRQNVTIEQLLAMAAEVQRRRNRRNRDKAVLDWEQEREREREQKRMFHEEVQLRREAERRAEQRAIAAAESEKQRRRASTKPGGAGGEEADDGDEDRDPVTGHRRRFASVAFVDFDPAEERRKRLAEVATHRCLDDRRPSDRIVGRTASRLSVPGRDTSPTGGAGGAARVRFDDDDEDGGMDGSGLYDHRTSPLEAHNGRRFPSPGQAGANDRGRSRSPPGSNRRSSRAHASPAFVAEAAASALERSSQQSPPRASSGPLREGASTADPLRLPIGMRQRLREKATAEEAKKRAEAAAAAEADVGAPEPSPVATAKAAEAELRARLEAAATAKLAHQRAEEADAAAREAAKAELALRPSEPPLPSFFKTKRDPAVTQHSQSSLHVGGQARPRPLDFAVGRDGALVDKASAESRKHFKVHRFLAAVTDVVDTSFGKIRLVRTGAQPGRMASASRRGVSDAPPPRRAATPGAGIASAAARGIDDSAGGIKARGVLAEAQAQRLAASHTRSATPGPTALPGHGHRKLPDLKPSFVTRDAEDRCVAAVRSILRTAAPAGRGSGGIAGMRDALTAAAQEGHHVGRAIL